MSTITFDFRHYYRKGERRESDQIAYQWDLGHVAEIYVPVNATYEIHYCFADFTETDDYAVESTTAAEDGGYKLTAHIPNKYFERSGELKVYVIGSDDNHVLTTYEGYISIRGRIKPDDYTDDDPENEATRILTEAREARDAAVEAAEQAEAAASQSAAQASIAEVYDATKTYAIGDYCLYDGQLYECTAEITTPEAWTAAHWTAATVGTELNDIKGDVTGLKEELNVINPKYSLVWELGKNVNSNGAVSTDASKALSSAIYCNPGDLYVRNTATKDNNNKTLIVYVNEYNGQTWLKRTTVPLNNPKLVIGQDTNNIRIGFGRNSADGAISSDDISAYYKDVFYRHTTTDEDVKALEATSFIMRGDITSLGFDALDQCVSPGLYTFTTAQISEINDMPVQITTGGYLKVFVSSGRMWQELITPVHHLIRYSTGVWTDAEKYLSISYETGSGVDSSTERISIDIPRRGNIREYIRYKMGHCIDTDVNSNVWRLCYIYNISTAGNESLMTTRGEFECAIHLADRDDFSGGVVHGDEVDEQVTFLIDGKKYTVDNIPPVCREFSIVRNSNLYDPSDSSVIIAKHGVEYKYTANGLVIKQSIKWVGEHSLTNCYLAMFPIKKAYSTYRFDDTAFEVVENNQTSYGVFINNAKMVTEFNNSFTSSMSIKEYPEGLPGGDRARVTDNSGIDYNKIYFVICNSGTVSDGDMWKSETVYDIT